MATITYDALLEQFKKRTSEEEARKILNLSLMRMGLAPNESYTADQALELNAMILADAAEQLMEGYMGMIPALQQAMEAGFDMTPETDGDEDDE